MKKNLHSFTLAEVLITLTIIGVIATLTIPNLMQAWKKHEVEARLKEVYSLLQNATSMARTDTGLGSYSEMYNTAVASSTSGGNREAYFLKNYLEPYLKVKKSCYNTRYDCTNMLLSVKNKIGQDSFQFLNRMMLENGMVVGVYQWPSFGLFVIAVDINGPKAPNEIGKDVFYTAFRESGWSDVDIYGGKDKAICNSGTGVYNGFGCFDYIKKSSWKIPDDYPVKKF